MIHGSRFRANIPGRWDRDEKNILDVSSNEGNGLLFIKYVSIIVVHGFLGARANLKSY